MSNEQIIENWAQRQKEGIKIVVDAKEYDIVREKRLLIPFHGYECGKVGLINRNAEVILEPKYDAIVDNCNSTEDLIRVGQLYSFGFARPSGRVDIYTHYKYGLIDAEGNFLLDLNYREILVSDDNQIFSLRDLDLKWGVVNRLGEIIVPFGGYNVIGRFWHGFAKVIANYEPGTPTYGIIDNRGKEVVPVRHYMIGDFYGTDYPSVCVDGRYIPFEELKRRSEMEK